MAVRNDVHVEWWRDPRIIVVEAPSTTITAQDLVDTLRTIEQDIDNYDDLYILDAFGKQALTATSEVGITIQLQAAQVRFESRSVPGHSGTTTAGTGDTGGLPGFLLYDTSINFIDAGVEPGDVVTNLTKGLSSDVIRVESANSIRMYAFNGTTQSSEVGDVYLIHHVEECTITGGNITSVHNGTTLYPILSSGFVSASREAASSGTLVVSGSGVTEQDKLDIRDRVWDAAKGDFVLTDSMGEQMNKIGQADILSPTQQTMLLEMYRIFGLDPTRPLYVSKTARVVGAEIEQTIEKDDAADSVTVTRQP